MDHAAACQISRRGSRFVHSGAGTRRSDPINGILQDSIFSPGLSTIKRILLLFRFEHFVIVCALRSYSLVSSERCFHRRLSPAGVVFPQRLSFYISTLSSLHKTPAIIATAILSMELFLVVRPVHRTSVAQTARHACQTVYVFWRRTVL